ncbi:MAG: 23S rRNA (adenine(2503)-C(2))-methyltransferase RlmN, partial [Proteobacteria bacterium]|nr:23S rRNA (adenine(2503)-C(2))-methyltransferase RlmN [Pseudomonadota bacterium]
MKNIRSLEKDELKSLFEIMGERSFRSKQLFKWLWQKLAGSFDEMTDFSKGLRERLKDKFYIGYPDIIRKQVSKDGTIKYLLKLEDGNTVETVWIPDGKRRTICVSTQVGCAMGCKFCYTGRQGLKRDLKFYEICDQVSVIKRDLGESPTNIVMMG